MHSEFNRVESRIDDKGMFRTVMDIILDGKVLVSVTSAPVWSTASEAFDAGIRAVEIADADNGTLPDMCEPW